jgi:hypothetical protein
MICGIVSESRRNNQGRGLTRHTDEDIVTESDIMSFLSQGDGNVLGWKKTKLTREREIDCAEEE